MAPNKTQFSKAPTEEYENDFYDIQKTRGVCAICGKSTNYKSRLSADYICSKECSKALWHDIFVKLHTDKRRRR